MSHYGTILCWISDHWSQQNNPQVPGYSPLFGNFYLPNVVATKDLDFVPTGRLLRTVAYSALDSNDDSDDTR